MELGLEPAVEGDPQGYSRFTHRDSDPAPVRPGCKIADALSRIAAGSQLGSKSNGKYGSTRLPRHPARCERPAGEKAFDMPTREWLIRYLNHGLAAVMQPASEIEVEPSRATVQQFREGPGRYERGRDRTGHIRACREAV